MSEVALRLESIYKKFRKGETFNSLRDLVPALTGRMFRQTELTNDNREFWALRDVSFEVERGEAFGIIGHNGAGKSTILKIISRIMKPTMGRVVVNGRLSALIEVSAGFHQDLTGRENIFLNGTILGMSRREISSKLEQIVAFSGLEEFIDTPVKRYSSGMYARLGFSVAAHVEPDVLVVDEVLSVGDYVFQQRCMERMRSVIREGTTVLFVSHNLKAVTELCQKAMLLVHGNVMEFGPTDAVVRRYLHDALERTDRVNKEAEISRVTIRGEDGKERSTFESGEKALVEVGVRAHTPVDKLAVVLMLNDEAQYEVFNTSTERLGYAPFSLARGQTYRCVFDLTLNVAHGAFYVCAALYRYDIQKLYDTNRPGKAIFIGSTMAVRGAVNLFPRIITTGIEEPVLMSHGAL